jgi:prepilin-type N-terminal cleavage/methylation domain-containing protein
MQPSRRRRAGQKGLTLIETVVALAIISIAVVGIAFGFSIAVRSGGIAQEQTSLEVAAGQLADYVQTTHAACLGTSGQCLVYVPCATASDYSLTGPNPNALRPPTPPASVSWSITKVVEASSAQGVSYLSTATDPNGHTLPDICRALPSVPTDWGMQEITITVSRGAQVVNETVWKGDL